MHIRNNLSGKLGFYISGLTDVDSARSLDFLNKMDESEGALHRMIRNVYAVLEYGEQLLRDMSHSQALFVYPDEIVASIEKEQNQLSGCFHVLIACKDTLMEHRATHFKPEDTLFDTLEEGISAVEQLHAQMEMIRWSIIEHNIDALPKNVSKPLSSSEDIDSFFDSL